MASIDLIDAHVFYPVFSTAQQMSLLANVTRRTTFGRVARDSGGLTVVHSLRGVSLSLRDGDRLGLVGPNGAGKTTLLRTLAGIIYPQQGVRRAEGRITCLLSLGAGMDPDRTGLANIEFLARGFGLSKARMASLVEDLVAFTELGDFLELPVRTYSAGMQVRLAFGLATALAEDIVLADEAMGAGDAHFMAKAAARARSLARRTPIFVFASHSQDIMRAFCDEAVWVEGGKILARGPVDEIWDRYMSNTDAAKSASLATTQDALV